MASGLVVLLDQNVPRMIGAWLLQERPSWTVFHATEAGLSHSKDHEMFRWAQAHRAIILTVDEDFADHVHSRSVATME